MGIARGPNIIKDNLVFGYDTGYGVANNNTATRFYPGEPTTNYVTDSSILQGGWGGSHSLIDSATKSFQLNVNSFHTDGAGWRSFMWDMRAHVGSAVTISATIEVPSNSPGNFAWVMMGQANSGGSGTSTNNYLGYSSSSERVTKSSKNTERISWSGTIGNTGTANQPNGIIGFTVWYNGGTNNTNSFIKVSNVQIEKISHETPFVNGTRSSTQSLIDLKRNTNINLSNVSFDSTGQPTFDGTDDYIPTPFTRGTLGDELTMIAYYKFDGSTGRTYTPIFGGKESGAGTEFFIGKNSSNTHIGVQDGNYTGGFVQGSNAWDGNYHQIVYTYENGSGKIYLDGVLKNTGTFSKCNAAEQITVGSEVEGSGYYMIGDIPRVCVYDEVLSAAEVLQDFNANKNRFNI